MFIKKLSQFKVDPNLFYQHLFLETQLLNTWIKENNFQRGELKGGGEIEFLILDKNYQLISQNELYVKNLKTPNVVLEAGSSQLEINTPVLPLTDNFLSTLHQCILTIWDKCCSQAKKNNHHLALIGTMPKVDEQFFFSRYITPQDDFLLMNESITQYRKGDPLLINLKGPKEKLRLSPPSLAIEGLLCSFQLHLEVPSTQLTHYYNIIQILSAPLLALSSNAPFFYGKKLWCESRIGIFEQIYKFPPPFHNTVFLEPNYFHESIFPIFEKNLKDYPYLLPIVAFKEPIDNMFHLRCQNSCIFRWNRPILDFNKQHEPFFRIEHRALSTGPTVVDMIANTAFFYGIVYYFANTSVSLSSLVNPKNMLYNFYEAARFGLSAQLKWNGSSTESATLLNNLLPLALQGLKKLGINSLDAEYYLNIIKTRLASKQNGCAWQQKYISKNNNDFEGMLAQYIKNQYSETPVGEWEIK